MIARTMPMPRLIPSRGKSQLAMNAPRTPIAISPISPKSVPRTILPGPEFAQVGRARFVPQRLSYCEAHVWRVAEHNELDPIVP